MQILPVIEHWYGQSKALPPGSFILFFCSFAILKGPWSAKDLVDQSSDMQIN